jgi:hypothetical protein
MELRSDFTTFLENGHGAQILIESTHFTWKIFQPEKSLTREINDVSPKQPKVTRFTSLDVYFQLKFDYHRQ